MISWMNNGQAHPIQTALYSGGRPVRGPISGAVSAPPTGRLKKGGAHPPIRRGEDVLLARRRLAIIPAENIARNTGPFPATVGRVEGPPARLRLAAIPCWKHGISLPRQKDVFSAPNRGYGFLNLAPS